MRVIKLKSLIPEAIEKKAKKAKKKKDVRKYTLWLSSTYGKPYKISKVDIVGLEKATKRFDAYKFKKADGADSTLELRDESGSVVKDKN